MSDPEKIKLGSFPSEEFDTHDAMGEHATKSMGDYSEFYRILSDRGDQPGVSEDDGVYKYLFEGGGCYFRAIARSDSRLLNGIFLGAQTGSRLHVPEGIYNADDDRVYDGMYHMWLGKIVPYLQFTKIIGAGQIIPLGLQSKGIEFSGELDDPTKHLVSTLGYEQNERWIIPQPELVIDANEEIAETILKEQEMPDDICIAISNGREVKYFEEGKRIGSMRKETGRTIVINDSEDNQIDILEPDAEAESLLDRYLTNNLVQRQIGLVTIKRHGLH